MLKCLLYLEENFIIKLVVKKKKVRELKSIRFKIWDGGRGKNVYLDGKLKIFDIILYLYIK